MIKTQWLSDEELADLCLIQFNGQFVTDQLANYLLSRQKVPKRWQEHASLMALRQYLRQRVKQLRDAEGLPRIFNIKRINASGEVEQLYLSEEWMQPPDYEYVIYKSYEDREYWRKIGEILAQRCYQRFEHRVLSYGQWRQQRG